MRKFQIFRKSTTYYRATVEAESREAIGEMDGDEIEYVEYDSSCIKVTGIKEIVIKNQEKT